MISGSMDLGAKEYQLEAAIGKVYASEAAWYVADEALQILGGMGFMKELPLERIVRDIRIFRIFEGANEVLRMFVALTGLQAARKHVDPWSIVSSVTKQKLGISTSSLSSPRSELAEPTKLLNGMVDHFVSSVRLALFRHREKIIDEQLILRRLADSAIDIYSTAAVISRTAHAFQAGFDTASHEALLARAFASDAAINTHRRLDEIASRRAEDKEIEKLGDQVLDANGFVAKHPLAA